MEKLRTDFIERIQQTLEIFPICGLLGSRQVGKTTIARQFAQVQGHQKVHYFDLEDYIHLAKLENPKLTLDSLEGLVIIDEIQRRPDLFNYLRVLADRPNNPVKILVLGSSSQELLKQSNESLAGRISYINVTPFSILEVHDQKRLWVRGGFPRSYLIESEEASFKWRASYLQTYFTQDLKDLGINVPISRIGIFWKLLTTYHGQIINYARMAQFLDVSIPKIKNYLAMLEGTFLLRQIQPWYENSGKRVIKSPKLYIRDSGLFHMMMNIENYGDIILSPQGGASFEGFAIDEILKNFDDNLNNIYFWGTHQENELDLFIPYKNKRFGFEIKLTDQPKITRSMRLAIEDLNLDYLFIVTPIEESFMLEDKIHVIALRDIKKIKSL
jgi:predicted AAA+ superfamily ATPase